MKFQKERKPQRVEWTDGAVLIIKKPYHEDVYRKHPGLSQEPEPIQQAAYMQESIVDWEGIEDGDSGKPLMVNDATRKEVADAVMGDEDMVRKILIAMKGSAGNL